ncbi:MAG: glycosyltransferase family 39 protein [Bacteroidota bacterium]
MKLQFNRTFSLFAALVLVHLLFFLGSQINTPAPLTDSEDYLNASRNLYQKGVLYCGDLSDPIVEEQYTRRPPLYPLFIGIGALTGSDFPLFILQILVSILSILLVYRIFLSGEPEQMHTLGMLLLLATPAQFIYANRIMAEIPFQLILILMAWSVYKFFQVQHDQTVRRDRFIWLFNLFLTLGMATKPVLFPFALFTILLTLFLFLRTRNRTFILAVILPVLWISLYSLWNFNRTGSAQYSSIQTANMVNYNLRYFIMGQEGSEAAAMEVDRLYLNCESETSYKEKNSCLDQGVKEVILKEPVKYGLFHLKGTVRYFLDPGRFDMVTFFNLKESDSPGFLQAINEDGIGGAFRFLKQQGWSMVIILGLISLFKLVKITGFMLYLFRGKEALQFRIFLGFLIGYLALVTGPLGASRFLLPVELLIIGGAVKGWAPHLLWSRTAR